MRFETSALFRTGMRRLKRVTWVPVAQRRSKKGNWETKWSQEGYAPYWQTETVPGEVKDAVDSGWFQPGATLLDIGCGSGDIAAWLAEQGFGVLGVDFSGSAIDRAKSKHLEIPGSLEFRVMDICREAPPQARFNALLDRGCFHGIPRGFRSAYMRNIISCSVPGTRMLLFAENRTTTPGQRIRDIEKAFQPIFEVTKAAKTHLAEVPGVAIWLVRQPSGLSASDSGAP